MGKWKLFEKITTNSSKPKEIASADTEEEIRLELRKYKNSDNLVCSSGLRVCEDFQGEEFVGFASRVNEDNKYDEDCDDPYEEELLPIHVYYKYCIS